jgi:hypothetical protein
MLGLTRVAALAQAIEDRAGRGGGVVELMAALDDAMELSLDAAGRFVPS